MKEKKNKNKKNPFAFFVCISVPPPVVFYSRSLPFFFFRFYEHSYFE